MNPWALIWLGEALIGLGVVLWNLRSAAVDLWALRKIGNGRRMLARNLIFQEFVRLVFMSGATLVGVMSLDAPSPRNVPLAFAFVAAMGLATLASILDSRVRRMLNKPPT